MSGVRPGDRRVKCPSIYLAIRRGAAFIWGFVGGESPHIYILETIQLSREVRKIMRRVWPHEFFRIDFGQMLEEGKCQERINAANRRKCAVHF